MMKQGQETIITFFLFLSIIFILMVMSYLTTRDEANFCIRNDYETWSTTSIEPGYIQCCRTKYTNHIQNGTECKVMKFA